LFGKDVEDRFIPLFTFCDGKEPLGTEAVKEVGIKFEKWFKFNNSAIWESSDS